MLRELLSVREWNPQQNLAIRFTPVATTPYANASFGSRYKFHAPLRKAFHCNPARSLSVINRR